MEIAEAVLILAALGQPTRLETFRLLVRSGPGSVPAGNIAEELNVPRNTMSSHLNILSRAGLVQSERVSRQILYKADLSTLASLTTFLVEGCCGGQPELCEQDITNIDALKSCG